MVGSVGKEKQGSSGDDITEFILRGDEEPVAGRVSDFLQAEKQKKFSNANHTGCRDSRRIMEKPGFTAAHGVDSAK